MQYSQIQFGEMSAEEELDKNPGLIENGFYDFQNVKNKLLNEVEFIVLGNKGSGKSIIGEHIKSTSGIQSDGSTRFVRKVTMKQFPYKSFAKIIPGDDSVNSKYPIAWKWAFLVQIILSFCEDNGKNVELDSEFKSAIDGLHRLGILPSTSLVDVAKLCSTNKFKIAIRNFEFSVEHEKKILSIDLFFSQINSYLEEVVKKLQSTNKHYIIIDGLDEQLNDKNHQFEAIAYMISGALEINSFLRRNDVPAKIIVLCRTDIFTRLPGANKNKLNGYTIKLNWYEDQIEYQEKNIIKLALFRAELSGYRDDFFVKEFIKEFPGGKNVYEYLLENTRYTPRDFLKLLTEIKNVYRKSPITDTTIEIAVKKYSTQYFWPEIEDELDGYFNRSEIELFKKALIHNHQRTFKLELFSRFCGENGYNDIDLLRIFETMYDCGAISNKMPNCETYFSKMRDENSFNPKLDIVLHRGTYKALTLA